MIVVMWKAMVEVEMYLLSAFSSGIPILAMGQKKLILNSKDDVGKIFGFI